MQQHCVLLNLRTENTQCQNRAALRSALYVCALHAGVSAALQRSSWGQILRGVSETQMQLQLLLRVMCPLHSLGHRTRRQRCLPPSTGCLLQCSAWRHW